MNKITFADLFAGGGGVTTGAFSIPDLEVVWALNHDKTAIETHALNHPETKHYQADIRTQAVSQLTPVDVLWASTECTQFSKAKGGGLKDIGSYMLAWELIRYIEHCKPYYLFIENVPEFVKWAPLIEVENKAGEKILVPDETRKGEEYARWVDHICDLGYSYEYGFRQAADYNAPTRRNRYIGIFARKNLPIIWPDKVRAQEATASLKKWRSCKEFIELENEGHSIFNRKNNLALAKQHRKRHCPNTWRRFGGGVLKHSGLIQGLIKEQFISKYYGTGINSQGLEEPLHTIRTKESHVLITVERMQVIADHVQTDNYQTLNSPLRTQLTRQTKQLVSFKTQFISTQNNSGGKPEANTGFLDNPLNSVSTVPKHQFLTASFNTEQLETQSEKLEFASVIYQVACGNEATQPIAIIKAIALSIKDVRARFLHKDELGPIMGFPKGYFDHISNKKAIKLIGNAVPTWLAEAMLRPNMEYLKSYLGKKAS